MTKFSPMSMMRGDGARARVMRGTLMTAVNFGGSKGLRLVSNLILTRILFPEAFGMMALITVFSGALEMFSDTRINASIIQSKRGHERIYLNTAWTIQILRGILLYMAALFFAVPAAEFYGEPMLAELLPAWLPAWPGRACRQPGRRAWAGRGPVLWRRARGRA